jgi:hypothetical protein
MSKTDFGNLGPGHIRTVYTHTYLGAAAKRALRDANTAERPGTFYDRMVAVVFAAFALEASANHIGDLVPGQARFRRHSEGAC